MTTETFTLHGMIENLRYSIERPPETDFVGEDGGCFEAALRAV